METMVQATNHKPQVTGLEFSHFVADNYGKIFASARDEESRIHNFIFEKYTGRIKQQVYRSRTFEPIADEAYAAYIRKLILESYGLAPVYRIPEL